MSYYAVKDSSGTVIYILASGAGSTGDPFQQTVDMADKPARDMGKIDIAGFDVALPAGTNNIGDVDILTGATDDAAAAGQLFPLAGLYQTTVDEVDAGDVGRLRMSARRGLMTATDYRVILADYENFTFDLLGETGVSLISGDFAVRDTGLHYIFIPVAAGGYNNIDILVTSSLDQAISYMTIDRALMTYSSTSVPIAQISVASGVRFLITSSSGQLGPGGASGVAIAAANAVYLLPLMSTGYVGLTFSCSVAPTSGTLSLRIARMS